MIPKTLLAVALWVAGITTAHALTEREAVAATLVLEAGGTGPRGMEAVMWVISNRSTSLRKSPLAVVTARRQFAVMRAGAAVAVRKAKRHPQWDAALRIYDRWKSGWDFRRRANDPTEGALYFESFKKKPPGFFQTLTPTARIGGNQFYAPCSQKTP